MPAVGASPTLPEGGVSIPEGSAPSLDVDIPAPSASVGVAGEAGSLGGIDVPSAGDVSAEMPSVGGGISGSIPGASGDVSMPSASVDVGMPSGSVDAPSASVDMPSASLDVPSGSADMPSGSVDMPSVGGEISGDLPPASLGASGSLPSGGGDVSMPSVSGAVEGVKGAVGHLSADAGAKIDDVEVKGPGMPSVSGEWKKPKKSMFGSIFGSGKGKMEVGDIYIPFTSAYIHVRFGLRSAGLSRRLWRRCSGCWPPAGPRYACVLRLFCSVFVVVCGQMLRGRRSFDVWFGSPWLCGRGPFFGPLRLFGYSENLKRFTTPYTAFQSRSLA